jgi:Flp pilus assembly protein TadB
MRKVQGYATHLAVVTMVLVTNARTALSSRVAETDDDRGASEPVTMAILVAAGAALAALVVAALTGAVNKYLPGIK